MRTRTTTAALAGLLLTLVGCSSGEDTMSEAPKAVPPYTVITERSRSTELLVEDATTDSATAAIRDWIDKNIGDQTYRSIQVVRTKDAGAIVCRAEYVADEQTAQVQTGGRIKADAWPHTEIDCPDPAGP